MGEHGDCNPDEEMRIRWLTQSHSLSLKRRLSWSELAGLMCVHGIPHGCRPGSAVLGHLDTDRWALPVPAT